MKKTYISPETSIHKLRTMHLIMGSPNATLSNTKANDREVLSRQGFWDDEEDY